MPESQRLTNLRADLARISGISAEEYAAEWGAWCRSQDRDPVLAHQRWIQDLERMIYYAEIESNLLDELGVAKEDKRNGDRARYDQLVAKLREVRDEERQSRTSRVGGDAFFGVK